MRDARKEEARQEEQRVQAKGKKEEKPVCVKWYELTGSLGVRLSEGCKSGCPIGMDRVGIR